MVIDMSMYNFSDDRLNHLFDDIYYDLNLLSVIPCDQTRNLILNHLSNNMSLLEYLYQQPLSPENLTTFTLEELSRFDGKNGNSAYVAVDGTVYDVTDNAAWAAATHFGLQAGKDLTSEFHSCHGGQPILSNLKVVGRLVEYE
jgi:predicted heme/steroid binding protein